MSILVTGGSGLVGSQFKSDRYKRISSKDLNLLNQKSIREYLELHKEIDSIIHCAAKVGGVQANSNDNKGFFNSNYQINNSIIKSCLEFEIPNFVNLLSTCIFPDKNITYPLTSSQIDNGAPHPSNYGYSYSKRLSGYETKIIKNLTY